MHKSRETSESLNRQTETKMKTDNKTERRRQNGHKHVRVAKKQKRGEWPAHFMLFLVVLLLV